LIYKIFVFQELVHLLTNAIFRNIIPVANQKPNFLIIVLCKANRLLLGAATELLALLTSFLLVAEFGIIGSGILFSTISVCPNLMNGF
jgi:hypothetical protein